MITELKVGDIFIDGDGDYCYVESIEDDRVRFTYCSDIDELKEDMKMNGGDNLDHERYYIEDILRNILSGYYEMVEPIKRDINWRKEL